MKERDKPFLGSAYLCLSVDVVRDVGKEIIFYSVSVLFFTGCYLY